MGTMVEKMSGGERTLPSFAHTLEQQGLELRRGAVHTLQVNTGYLCDLSCTHCHLDCGPARTEVMSRETMDEVITFARRCRFEAIDVTGGAPELVPGIAYLIEGLSPLAGRLTFRSNLSALAKDETGLLGVLREARAVIVSSFPSVNTGQAESQRGEGILGKSVEMLRKLNEEGYGIERSGLELDLVANPTGAFLPPPQCQAEKKLREDLRRKFGVSFTNLYVFANVPLGRFRRWLERSGNLESYLEGLASRFNPATISGLMCRGYLCVSWDGHLFDCDFNLAAGIGLGGTRRHLREPGALPEEGIAIPTGDYCYACTAGSGFT